MEGDSAHDAAAGSASVAARSPLKEGARRALSSPPVAAAMRWVCHRSWVPDRTRHSLVHRFANRLTVEPTRLFSYDVAGTELRLHPAGLLRTLYWSGAWEAEAMPAFVAYAQRSDAILDVGASEGIYALVAAAANPSAVVLAFEPGVEQLDRFRANLAANAAVVGDRIHVSSAALADHAGTEAFFEPSSYGNSSLNPGFRADAAPRMVEVITGDAVVDALIPDRRVGLIKVDTESTEPDVLRGLRRTIERDRPAICCEVLAGRCEEELTELLAGWGYRSYWLTDEGAHARSPIAGDRTHRWVNWLFLPDDEPPLAHA